MESTARPAPLLLTSANVAVLAAAGHPIYLIKAPDAPVWDYQRPIVVREIPGLQFKRHLLLFETKGHMEALELEVTAGRPPSRSELMGKTLVQTDPTEQDR